MGKHTPGPWRCGAQYIVGPNDETIVQAKNVMPPANAYLIAAAPDMLAALRLAEKEHSRGRIQPNLYDAVKAAIAKAEGRS